MSSHESGHYGWRSNDRVVPAYALTQGRTRSRGSELALETLVRTSDLGLRYGPSLQLESQSIVAMCHEPLSIAEIGAVLQIPVGVARVLVSDLAQAGYLNVAPPAGLDANGRPTRQTLERLLDGLRAR